MVKQGVLYEISQQVTDLFSFFFFAPPYTLFTFSPGNDCCTVSVNGHLAKTDI